MTELGTLTIFIWLVANGRNFKRVLYRQFYCTHKEAVDKAREFASQNSEMIQPSMLSISWQAEPQDICIQTEEVRKYGAMGPVLKGPTVVGEMEFIPLDD